jgi:hypothetical protein
VDGVWEGGGVMEIIIDVKDSSITLRPVEGIISADSPVFVLKYRQFYHTPI